jgi:hypothetical protein
MSIGTRDGGELDLQHIHDERQSLFGTWWHETKLRCQPLRNVEVSIGTGVAKHTDLACQLRLLKRLVVVTIPPFARKFEMPVFAQIVKQGKAIFHEGHCSEIVVFYSWFSGGKKKHYVDGNTIEEYSIFFWK